MPEKWCIPDINNHEFWTSIGDWSGDAVWRQEGIGHSGGLATMVFLVGQTQKQMSLSNPNILLGKGKTHRVTIAFNVEPITQTINTVITLSDGNNNISKSTIVIGSLNGYWYDDFFDLPKNFNPQSGMIKIQGFKSGHTTNILFDVWWVHVTYRYSLQYLPMLRVG